MRKFLFFFSRPGVCIAIVGALVLCGGFFLWRGMVVPPAEPVARNAGIPAAGGGPRAAASRALLRMVYAAYEEPSGMRLGDVVKQADFALVQAMLRSAVPLDGAVMEKAELRHAGDEPYHFQRIRLNVGNDPLPFITALHASLKAWAEGAAISRAGDAVPGSPEELWGITVDGVMTHELVLATATPSQAGRSGEAAVWPGSGMRRMPPGGTARLAIVIDDIGEDVAAARALAHLPYPVTFAVWPRSANAKKTAELGHAAGREILIHQPAEPMKYPEINPGPAALLTSLTNREIEARVRDALTRVPYAVGMNNHMGSRFTRDGRAAAAMVRPLKQHGLFVLDSLTHPGSVLYAEASRHGVPALKRDVFLDSVPGKEHVLGQLRKAEKIARVTGHAVAIGHPLPYTLAALKEWAEQRDARIRLVRLSDLLFPSE